MCGNGKAENLNYICFSFLCLLVSLYLLIKYESLGCDTYGLFTFVVGTRKEPLETRVVSD